MGTLRVYLALCVIATHAGPVFPWPAHEGRQAVQIFFVISGFYMALVLSTRYTSPATFYRSRFLRIFPAYWIVCLAAVAIGLLGRWWLGDPLGLEAYFRSPLSRNGLAGILVAAASNVTLVGQDLVMFLRHPGGESLGWTANFAADPNPLWHFLVLPQCWSVSLELCFYLLAPFLNRQSTRTLLLLVSASVVLRLAAYRFASLAHDPWTSRFFPFELACFGAGMLAYRLYARGNRPRTGHGLVSGRLAHPWIALGVLAVLATHAWATRRLAPLLGAETTTLLGIATFVIILPPMFALTSENSRERRLGDLSYPIYLVQFLVIDLLRPFTAQLANPLYSGPIAAFASLGAAVALDRICLADLERHRRTAVAPPAVTSCSIPASDTPSPPITGRCG